MDYLSYLLNLSFHFYSFTSRLLNYFLLFQDFSVFQYEFSFWMIWIVDWEFLLSREEAAAAAAEDVVEVHEGDGENQRQDEQEEVQPEYETVVILEDVWLVLHGEPHYVAEEDVAGNTDGHVDLGVLQTEEHPAVLKIIPAEVVRLGECEECEDRQHDEGGMVPQDSQWAGLGVQCGRQG